ncbi:MAG: quinone-interacting membrane-bound oxidoreductase complex subunit QmoC [Nitrospirae bacterium]|nr:quinone-interacting membrane-bound oxidoreductase complex subunit QmoC [Nitrospirota bacterium]
MTEQVIIPDLSFVKDIIASGGDTLKKCFQCAACSVVCSVAPDNRPFPRKEMLYAQWGLKDRLLSSPDIWLCHNCNDCTKYCPRGARPGDVLSAIRQKFIEGNSIPSIMGKIAAQPKMTLLSLAIPFILFLVLLGLTDRLHIHEGEIVYSKFFPIQYIEAVFISAVGLAGIAYLASLVRFWKGMSKGNGKAYSKGFAPAFIEALIEFVKHSRFSKCGPNADRRIVHMLVFYGFAGLFITTTWVTIYYYFFKKYTPILLSDPLKWVANISAAALLIGAVLLFVNRLKDKGFVSKGSSFDWTFAIIILLLCITGILTELIRLADIAFLAYPMYFIHLLLVFYTIVYFPYSKLAHIGYRMTALTYSKMTNKEF